MSQLKILVLMILLAQAPVPKEKDICDGILAMATSEMDLSSDDIHVLVINSIVQLCTVIFFLYNDQIVLLQVVTLSYGMKKKKPMLYYTSEDQDETVRLPRDKVTTAKYVYVQCLMINTYSELLCMFMMQVSPLSPETTKEYHIRVYVKKSRHKENAKV